MQVKLSALVAAAAAALTIGMAATPASAAIVVSVNAGPCQLGDINPGALACSGYFDGNLINGSRLDDQVAALALIGLVWDKTTYDEAQFKLTPLNGADINFSQLVTGISYIGVHYGAGSFPNPKPQGGATAFYKIDGGTGLDIIDLVRGSSSNAYLYSVTTPPCQGAACGGGGNAVPEPAVWAMMIMGFGAVGAVMRRRRFALA